MRASAPTVTQLSPASGPTAGGTKVTVTGSGFSHLTKVTFGGVPGTHLRVHSRTTLTVTAPKGRDGVVDVRVTGRHGTSKPTASTRYTYAPGCASTVIDVSGAITADTTWKAGCGIVYHVSGSLAVVGHSTATSAYPVTLTVPAGAIVKFDDGASLGLSTGRLVVEGTAQNPVVFTSIRDDSVGGDTNKDGAQTKPTAHSWGDISWANSAGNYQDSSTIQVSGLQMRYGGNIVGGHGDQWSAGNTSTLRVTNSTLFRSGSINATVRTDNFPYDPVLISGNTLRRSGTISVASQDEAATLAQIQVSDNKVVGSTSSEPAFSITGSLLRPSLFAGNIGHHNKVNAFRIYGTLVENWTMPTGMTYVVGTPTREFGASFDSDGLTIAKGVTLTVPAGAVVKFQRTTDLGYSGPPPAPSGYAGVSGDGTLVVKGTAARPVVFTSIHDDTVGGDTDGNGHAVKPAKGDWDGLVVRYTGTLQARHLVIRYAGSDTHAAAPTITSISPASGPVAGGTTVTITGTHLTVKIGPLYTGLGSITVGGVSVQPSESSDTRLVFVTPPHAAGAVDVVIPAMRGTVTKTAGFSYLPG
ncbi:MAG: IPT/TIG domain-containing protein [Micropruina sp.]|uniref:IPT/TIG domain-containing protein n=1 Tax=Micropruina sp. TaxID=2737536 RepID=UPI0039E6563C